MMKSSLTTIAGLIALTASLVTSQYYDGGGAYGGGNPYQGNAYNSNVGYYGPHPEVFYQQPYGGGNSYGSGGGQGYSDKGYQGSNPVYKNNDYGGGNYGGGYGGGNYGSGGSGYSVKSYQGSSSSYKNDDYGGGSSYGQGYSDKSYQDSNSGYKNDDYGEQDTNTCASPWKCCKARRNKHPYVKQICDGCGNNVCNTNDPNHWSRVQTPKPTPKPTNARWGNDAWGNDGWNGGNTWGSGQRDSKWGSAGACCQTLDACPFSFPVKTDTLVLDVRMDQRLRLKVCCKQSQSQDRWGGDRWSGGGNGDRYEPTQSPTIPVPTLSPTLSPSCPTLRPRCRRGRELMYEGAYGGGNPYQGNPSNNNGGYYGPYPENFYKQPYDGGNSYGSGGNSYGQGYSDKSYQDSNSAYTVKSYGGGDYGGDDYGGNSYGGDDYKGNNYGGDDYRGNNYGGNNYGGVDYGGDDYGGDDYGGNGYGGGDDYGRDEYYGGGDYSDKSYYQPNTKGSITVLDNCPSQYEPTMTPTTSPTESPTLTPTDSD